MTTRHLTLALIIGATSACTKVDGDIPDGFARFETWEQLKAVSPDGVMYRVRIEDNDPEAELPFWREALKKRMIDAGYVFVTDGEIESSGTDGYLLELAAPVGQQDFNYLLAVFVRGPQLVIAEAAGEVTRVAARRKAIVAAMGQIR